MRRVCRALFGAIAVICFAPFASAADMAAMPAKAPVVAPVAAPAAAFDWSGFYAGAVGALGWAHSQHCQVFPGGFRNCDPGFPQTDMSGWQAGGTLGYNRQWNQWVFGIEGDWSGGKLKGVSRGTAIFGCVPTCDNSITSVGTVRGRVGYAFDRWLPYLTAGAAFSELKADIAPGTAFFAGGSTVKTDFAWGGGVEYAFWNSFSAKLEYLNITRLGDFTYDNGNACGAATPCYVHVADINLVRLGLNYRFWAGP